MPPTHTSPGDAASASHLRLALARKHAREHKPREKSKVMADINVTPLVDVVLVLLIIFMVVTPLLEKDIGVRVPATEQVEEKQEVPPDQLVVRVEADGTLTINAEKVPNAEYIDRLKTILAEALCR